MIKNFLYYFILLLLYLNINNKSICLKKTFYELFYCCSIHIKCNSFYIYNFNKFKDSSFNEIINYENNINIITIKKIPFKKIDKANNPKISKEIIHRNMTYTEFLQKDDLRYLYQREINELFKKKYEYLKNLPFNNSNKDEQYYSDTVRFLYNEIDKSFKFDKKSEKIPQICNGSIDVAWTFVNASDPIWQIEYNKTNKNDSAGFYRDYGGLKYSMRSVYKYIKYAKNWFVIISGESQIPKFLNLSYDLETNSYKLNYKFDDNEKKINIHFIYHRDIFPNKKVLPNFASDSIESAFAFIPNISECFIYLNDDFFIGSKLTPSFFIKENNKLNLFKGFRLSPYIDGNNWDNSVYYTNRLLNKDFGVKRRLYPMHACYFWRKSILLDLNKKYKVQHSLNRYHKFRKNTNIVIPFLHSNYALEMGYGDEVFPKDNWFKYFKIQDDFESVNRIKNFLNKHKNKVKCFCVNDGVGELKNNTNVFQDFEKVMEEIFPEKLPFEI